MADDLPPNVRAIRDVQYGKNAAQKLDLYLPQNMHARTPVILWIHGGRWQTGDKALCLPICLADKGYAIASINYRLSGDAKFPAQIHDCKAAVRYLRSNAAKYNIDPDHVGAMGESAGGHLAALLGTSSGVKELEGPVEGKKNVSSSVQAVCEFYGPTNLVEIFNFQASHPGLPADEPKRLVTKLLGGGIDTHRALAEQASPITHVSEKSPPFLILHGGNDKLVPVEQSETLVKLLKKAGVDAELQVMPGAPHSFFSGTDYLIPVEKFFDKKLRNLDSGQRGIANDNVSLIASFRQQQGSPKPAALKFYSNGRLGSPDSINTWSVNGNKLVMCWYDPKSPTSVWVDNCTLDKDGKGFNGRNQSGNTVIAELIEGGNLRNTLVRHAGDMIPAEYKAADVSKLPLDEALGKATATRWAQEKDGYSIALAGVSPAERKDAAAQFAAIITKETGSTSGLTISENRISISSKLAQKIVDKFSEAQKIDKADTRLTTDFIRTFSGTKSPLLQSNFEHANRYAKSMAELANGVPGLDKPAVRMDRFEVALTFEDQQQAEKFAAILSEAKKQSDAPLEFTVAKSSRAVTIKYSDLNSLSEKQAKEFMDKAADIAAEAKKKGKDNKRKVSAIDHPDFLKNLQASVDKIEQTFGVPKQTQPAAADGDLLQSPRTNGITIPSSDKGIC